MEPTDKKVGSGEPQLLQAMVAHWIHEDNLYWTQMRHLLLLQLALFAAWYGLYLELAALAMSVNIGVAWLLWDLAKTISRNRDANLDAIRILSIAVARAETEKTLKPLLNGDYQEWGLFRFARHSLEPKKDKGKRFQRVVFAGCAFRTRAPVVFGRLREDRHPPEPRYERFPGPFQTDPVPRQKVLSARSVAVSWGQVSRQCPDRRL